MSGKLITKDGREIVLSDPNGDGFPWRPKPLPEILSNCNFTDMDMKGISWEEFRSQGMILGFFFSAHWVGILSSSLNVIRILCVVNEPCENA